MGTVILKRASMLMTLALIFCATAFGQTGTIEGTIKIKNADGTLKPAEGATVLIRRTDIKGEWTVKTEKNGHYVRLGMPLGGTFLVIAYGPGMQPTWQSDVRLTRMPTVDLVAAPGDGRAVTAEEVADMMKQAKSAPAAGGQAAAPQMSEADRAKAMKEKEEYDKAVKESQALQGSFDQARVHYNTGIEAMKTKNYTAAVPEFEAASAVDPAKHAALLELAYKGNANLAEAHYQLGVDLFNNKKKEEAKPHFEKALAAASKALELAATNTKDPNINNDLIVYYGIYAKNAMLLIEHFGKADVLPATVQNFDKAAELDAANKSKWMVMKADAYRNAGMSEEASTAYKALLAIDPNSIDAMYGLGLTLIASQDTKVIQEGANSLGNFVAKAPPDDRRLPAVKEALEAVKNAYKIEAEKPAKRPGRKP